MDTKTTLLIQLAIRGAIFLLFFIGLFMAVPSLLLYLLFPLIITNLVLGFFNGKKNIIVNLLLLALSPLLFIIVIDYIVTIIGTILSLVHFLMLLKEYKKPIKK